MEPHFTKMEQRFLALFADGMQHTKDEMLEIVRPSGIGAVRRIVTMLNKKLAPGGTVIVAVSRGRGVRYAHFRRIVSGYGG
jgi:hypothetical protein